VTRFLVAVLSEADGRMRSLFRIGGWIFTVLPVAGCAASVCAQSPPRSPAAQARNVDLVCSSQPDFEASIDVNYPELRQSDGFEGVKPFIALLRNNSEHGIKAFVVKWVIVGPAGHKYEFTRMPWAGPGTSDPLTGDQVIWKPGELRLVSPSFDWSVSRQPHESRAKLLSDMSKGRLGVDPASVLSIDIWVDAVVYDDGFFSGPDKGNFYDRYEREQKGEQEEGAFALSLLELNLSDDEIVQRLSTDIEKSRERNETDPASLEDAARGKEARMLLAVFNRKGRSGLKTISLLITNHARTLLRKE
jgi:hypothetical protein